MSWLSRSLNSGLRSAGRSVAASVGNYARRGLTNLGARVGGGLAKRYGGAFRAPRPNLPTPKRFGK